MQEEINTEQAIMNAAETIFIKKGYGMAKTTEIAKEAGVTHAMLHYYFRTKENLFNQVFEKKARLIAHSFFGIIQNDLPFTERIKRGVENHFDFIAANPKLPLFVLNEIISNEERLESCKKIFIPLIAETFGQLKAAIDAETMKGNIRPIETIDLIMSIVSVNLAVFIAQPIIQNLVHWNQKEYALFLEHRKAENVELILSRLRL